MNAIAHKVRAILAVLSVFGLVACNGLPLPGVVPGPSNSMARVLARPKAFANALAFAPDGSTLAIGTQGEGTQLWRVTDSTLLHTLAADPKEIVRSVAFTADGQKLLVGSSAYPKQVAQLWRVSDGTLLTSWNGKDPVAVAPKSGLFAIGGANIALWVPDGMTATRTLATASAVIMNAAFAPDGQQLAVGTTDGVQVWRVGDGTLLHTLPGWVSSLAYTPDGLLIAAPNDVNSEVVNLWRAADGRQMQRLVVPGAPTISQIHSLAIAPDGNILATANNTGQVRFWRLADGALLDTKTFTAEALAFSPDSKTLAVAGYQVLELWTLPIFPAAPSPPPP